MHSMADVLPFLQRIPVNKVRDCKCCAMSRAQAERHALLPKTWELMAHYNVGAFIGSVEAMLGKGIDPASLLAALHESMTSSCGTDRHACRSQG